jgi:hypothetical protein
MRWHSASDGVRRIRAATLSPFTDALGTVQPSIPVPTVEERRRSGGERPIPRRALGKGVEHDKSGWTEESTLSLWDAAELYPEARHVLLTDVGRDGMLAGPNFELLDEAVERLPWAEIQASGGVASLDELRRLRTAGAIVGKAIWEGRFTLAEALDAGA